MRENNEDEQRVAYLSKSEADTVYEEGTYLLPELPPVLYEVPTWAE